MLLSDLTSPVNRTYYYDHPVEARFLLSHFGPQPVEGATLEWKLVCEGKTVSGGRSEDIVAARYALSEIGNIRFTCPVLAEAKRMTLHAELKGEDIEASNSWPLWFFPDNQWLELTQGEVVSRLDLPERLLRRYPFVRAEKSQDCGEALRITDRLGENLNFLASGGRVMLVKPRELPSIVGRFWLGWWNPGWGNQGAIVTDHPALARFPHTEFVGMEFQALIGGKIDDMYGLSDLEARPERVAAGYVRDHESVAIEYKLLPFSVDRIVLGLTWNHVGSSDGAKAISYLFELKVGKGKLLVVGFDMLGPLPEQEWMFDCLMGHCLSDSFDPRSKVGTREIREWLDGGCRE